MYFCILKVTLASQCFFSRGLNIFSANVGSACMHMTLVLKPYLRKQANQTSWNLSAKVRSLSQEAKVLSAIPGETGAFSQRLKVILNDTILLMISVSTNFASQWQGIKWSKIFSEYQILRFSALFFIQNWKTFKNVQDTIKNV